MTIRLSRLKYLIPIAGLSLVMGYLQLISPALLELDYERDREQAFRNSIERKQQLYVNLDAVKAQMIEISSRISRLFQAMPYKIDIDAEGGGLVASAGRHGLSPVTLIFMHDVKTGEYYDAYPIRLSLTGTFNDIYHYLHDGFYATDRVITLTDFKIEKIAGSDNLVIQADGLVFEYTMEEDR